ncbi:MAG: hypothetical protein AAGD14_17170 [Planctomycetota bacterium]
MRVCVLLILLGGCLDYEVTVDTTVKEDGSFVRTVRVHEQSDKHRTWTRYAPPRAPYEMTGSDAEGHVATLRAPAGRYKSGLRVLAKDLDEGPYRGAAGTLGKATYEGDVSVTVQDLLIGKLYRYEESLALGIDPVVFRRELDYALELGLDLLVAFLELAEPDTNFRTVQLQARRTLLPRWRSAFLSLHAELVRINHVLPAQSEAVVQQEMLRETTLRLIESELLRMGMRRKASVGRPSDFEKLMQGDAWEVDPRTWELLLAPLAGKDDAWRARLLVKVNELVRRDGGTDKSSGFDLAYARAVPESRRPEVERRMHAFARSAIGAPVANNLFDSHDFRFRVQLPGQVLSAGQAELHRFPVLEWRVGNLQLANPRFVAYSFVRSERMVGTIDDVGALLDYAAALAKAKPEERNLVEAFLVRAREDGLEKAGAGKTGLTGKLVKAVR